MHRDLSDSDLIIRSINAPSAFTELSLRHGASVHDYLRRRAGRRTADRLTLKTFAVAFRGRERHQPRSNDARAWFLGIATDLLGRERRRGLPWLEPRTAVDDRALAHSLAGLDRRDRDLVCLNAIAGLSPVEVARAVGRSSERVEQRLRALEPSVGGVTRRAAPRDESRESRSPV